jgi:DNA-directed RNA polymerase subunit M/transcription elongation factor TFIIS
MEAFDQGRLAESKLIFKKLQLENPDNHELKTDISLLFNELIPSKQAVNDSPQYLKTEVDNSVHCPQCRSTSISSEKNGYNAVAGVLGAVVAGPLGLIAGVAGSDIRYNTCQKCGHRWKI